MGTYYVDYINGDSANDGLTPANSLDSIENAPEGTDFLINTIWVRNTSQITFTADVTINNKDIIFWPTSQGDMYSERPQEGIDAGWDSDDNSGFINLVNFAILNTGLSGTLIIRNAFFNSTDTSNRYGIKNYGGTLRINNSIIKHISANSQGFLHMNTTKDYASKAFFKDIDFTCIGVLVSNNGYLTSYDNQDVEIISSNFLCTSILYEPSSNSGPLNQHHSLYIKDSIIECTSALLYAGSGNNSISTLFNLQIITSNVMSEFVSMAYNSDYFCLNCNIIGSTINTANNSLFAATAYYNSVTSYENINIISSSIECGAMFKSDSIALDYGSHITSYGKIKIINSNIKMSGIFHCENNEEGIYNFGGITIVSSTIENSGLAIPFLNIHNNSSSSYSDIHMSDFSSSFDFIKGIGDSKIYLDNINVQGALLDTNKNADISAERSSFGDLKTKGNIEISDCQSQCNGSFGDGSVSVIATRSLINSMDPILTKSGVFIESTVKNDMTKNIDGEIKLYSSTINDASVAYQRKTNNCLYKLSPVFRLGGSSSAINITAPLQEDVSLSVDEVRGIVPLSAQVVNVYMCSNSRLKDDYTSYFYGKLKYKTNSGVSGSVKMTFSDDSSSSWDGVLVSSHSIKISAPVSGLDIDFSQKIYAEIGALMGPGENKDLYFDLNFGVE